MNEYSEFRSPYKLMPGEIELNETLEWTNKPASNAIISQIQAYFGYLAMKAIKHQYSDLEQDFEMTYNASLTIYGDKTKTTSNLFEFMECLMEELPNAERFIVRSSYNGPGFAGAIDDEIMFPFCYSCDLAKNDDAKNAKYKCFQFLYNHGEGGCMKFENGKWLNFETECSKNILDKDFGEDWWCWNLDLVAEFDFEKYPEILCELQNAVRKYIPKDQIDYCERTWEDGDLQILVSSISWSPR